MGNKRNIDFQWVENGVFEMCERYSEQALRLLQDTEVDSKEKIFETITDQIRKDIDRLEDLIIKKIVLKSTSDALDFNEPERGEISNEHLQQVVGLTDEFRNKALQVLRVLSPEDRMNQAPFLLAGVMRCIVELRKKINRANDEFLSQAEFEETRPKDESLSSNVPRLKRTLSPKLLRVIALSFFDDRPVEELNALGKSLGINSNLYYSLSIENVPYQGEKRVAYIKIWNWVHRQLVLAVESDAIRYKTKRALRFIS